MVSALKKKPHRHRHAKGRKPPGDDTDMSYVPVNLGEDRANGDGASELQRRLSRRSFRIITALIWRCDGVLRTFAAVMDGDLCNVRSAGVLDCFHGVSHFICVALVASSVCI